MLAAFGLPRLLAVPRGIRALSLEFGRDCGLNWGLERKGKSLIAIHARNCISTILNAWHL